MASSSSSSLAHLLLLLTVTTTVFFISLTPSSADMDVIQNLCKTSIHYDLCMSSLSSDPTALDCYEDKCVAGVAVKNAIRNSTGTQNVAKGFLRKKPHPPSDQLGPLRNCVKIYGDMTSYLEFMLGKVDSDVDGFTTEGVPETRGCEDSFPTKPSPMKNWNDGFHAMLIVAVELVDLSVG